jgi:Ser/Thr protein kinase RdoA (MazF antagonist)
MDNLRPISSILYPEDIARFIAEKYAIAGKCKLLKAGINHSYLLTTAKEKYVFRLYSYNWRSLEEINAEIELLRLLSDNQMPVSFAIANEDGLYVHEIKAPEGNRFGVLFSYAEGEKILTFSEQTHYNVGVAMAKIHQLTKDKTLHRVHYGYDNLLNDTFNYLPEFLPTTTEEYQFMLQLKKFLATQLKEANSLQLRKGIVHLDIWFDNMNISPNGEIVIFDFDFCGHGWLCLDLAYYILQIHSVEAKVEDFYLKKDAFLNGYQSITTLTAEEQRLLPMLGLAAYVFYIGIQCKRFNDWSNTFLNELYLSRFINLRVKRWFDFNELKFQ